jgi:hypothetical protein
MVYFSLFPVFALCTFCLLSNIILAFPTSRFPHDLQSLPTRDIQKNQETSIAAPMHRLRKRGLPGAVYICTSDNFRGACAWTAPSSRCHIAGTGNNSVRSIGPDEDGYCVLYEKATCTGTEVKTVRYPGQASDMPAFMSLKCYPDRNRARANATVASSILTGADPRLAGGVGSMERKNLEGVMEQMEKDGFRQGMIGLRKGHYY